ncbi:MAG: helix-turn-helix transcriptional regulator [Pseudomonadota bacterium]
MNSGNVLFGRRLKELRLTTDLSQKQLGIQAGIDQFVASTRINRYEQAVHRADFSIAERMAEILDAPVGYFFTTDDTLAELMLIYHRCPAKLKKYIAKNVRNTVSQD